MSGGSLVVGYDGSRWAEAALRWAADRADRHGQWLDVVCAVHRRPGDGRRGDDAMATAEQLVATARERLALLAPAVFVTARVEAGAPVHVLLRSARTADAVVVGAHGRGERRHLGSVGAQLAAHADCPVVVARPQAGAGVVVGVDGSPGADRALGFGFAEAAGLGEPLVAVHAWLPAYAGLADVPYPGDLRPVEAQERALLQEHLAVWREAFPSVEVRPVLRVAGPVGALLREARGARLLVVGPHAPGSVEGVLRGSVGRAVLRHAECTVAVVRGADRRSATTGATGSGATAPGGSS